MGRQRYAMGFAAVMWLATACGDEGGEPPRTACDVVSYSDVFFASDDPVEVAGLCMPRSFTPDADGQVSCVVLEGREAASCSCNAPRQPVMVERRALADELADLGDEQGQAWSCFCELPQLEATALSACQENVDVDPASMDGWCYVDSTVQPPLGNPDITAPCDQSERRMLRLIGENIPAPESGIMLYCEEATSC